MECDMRLMSVLVQSMVGVGGVEMPSLELPFLHQLLNGSSDEEDEKLFIQRSSSLKTTKSPPRSPHTKKIVRFADVLGLDLADVRTFLDEIPQVPKSAFRDLDPRSLSPTPSLGVIRTQPQVRSSKKTLVPSFHQPVSMSDFYTRIREQKVLLENAFLGENFKVRGTVRVMNLDFHKSVYFRYTLDDWKTFKESQASYSSGSCDGFSDRFEFSLMVKESEVEVGGRLVFALRFDCQGSEHWDNNRGRNYVFECVPSSSQNMMNSLCVPETTADDPWINHMWM